jgi:hypothetical protein
MKRLVTLFVLLVACGSKEPAKEPSKEGPATAGPDEDAKAMGEKFIAACEGKAAGDACEAKVSDAGQEKTLAGKCVQPPAESEEKRIVCLPDELPK